MRRITLLAVSVCAGVLLASAAQAAQDTSIFLYPPGHASSDGRPLVSPIHSHIANKREWPDWTPPAQMLRRRPDLPHHMEGGIDNPLGARAMYIAGTLFRIHGSNEPDTIGQAVSSGCIRMTNDDVTDLYSRVRVGSPVIVMR
jgi:lipoprotein-anchoring transpeptidase ErfK/SrfK